VIGFSRLSEVQPGDSNNQRRGWMNEIPTLEEAQRSMVDFLRYSRKYVPISEQRNQITRKISQIRGLIKNPDRLRMHRKEESNGEQEA